MGSWCSRKVEMEEKDDIPVAEVIEKFLVNGGFLSADEARLQATRKQEENVEKFFQHLGDVHICNAIRNGYESVSLKISDYTVKKYGLHQRVVRENILKKLRELKYENCMWTIRDPMVPVFSSMHYLHYRETWLDRVHYTTPYYFHSKLTFSWREHTVEELTQV